ncbi:Cytochrome P450 1A2 [Orchesella cincta]|uniref:Cytochrome P450 1A2 n=1 Tax=Orchesella cincta TaxID=48709 RepID=A0A1D2M7E2_ORCCI|nr:Cytochrome P450 1A2 [Orchesella cincta]
MDCKYSLICYFVSHSKPRCTTLPYTEAIVLETLRLSSIAPLGAPHRMTADTLFHGYFLPKDTTVISNLWAIHHDPKVWGEDVNEFRPEKVS